MKRPPKPPFDLLRSLPHHPQKSLKRQNKNVNPENPPVQNRQPPKKVATRKKIQTPNRKSNPKHKKPSLKVATFTKPKVAT
jgi:hypothetical protein